MIRRFAVGWWILVLVSGAGLVWQLSGLRQSGLAVQPLPGGIYTEALSGSVKTINPILPEGTASADAARLVFNGLTRYNAQGRIEPDLASGWEISADGKTYTFKLRKGVKWHDGVPFTSADVAFTLAAIQNPDTRSPLNLSWKGVKVQTPDELTVRLILPKPFTPFLAATTVGIIPLHLLANTEPAQLRVSAFNQKPVGTGPFKLERFDAAAGQIEFKANADYFNKRPLLDGVIFKIYGSAELAYDALVKRQVMGAARVPAGQAAAARSLASLRTADLATPDEVAVFLRTNAPRLQYKNVRQALARSTYRQSLIRAGVEGEAVPLASPLMPTDIGLAGAPVQPAFDPAAAAAELEASGWVRQPDGSRKKAGQTLEINLVTQEGVYGAVASELKKQWSAVGVKLHITETTAAVLQQSYIRPRNYEALIYGINVGSDPDVYAFWHSSQVKDPGLNLSEYSSPDADKALEAGRTVQDKNTRSAKYRAFVQAWVSDTPAVMLYSPTYTYAQNREVYGNQVRRLITPSDRFYGIEDWAVRTRLVNKL